MRVEGEGRRARVLDGVVGNSSYAAGSQAPVSDFSRD